MKSEMPEPYNSWVTENVKSTYGKCTEVTEAMQKKFPELKRVRGHYDCLSLGKREHWWLTTESGKIIDPTAAQFPSNGHGEYIPWIEGSKEPIGKCMNCGAYCLDDPNFCGDKCSKEYMHSLKS